MARKRTNKPRINVLLPKKMISGAVAQVNPRDYVGTGQQFHELALMPFLNASAENLRKVWEMTRLLRHLMRIEGPISTATFNLVQVADSGFTVNAYDANTNHYDADGSDLAMSLLSRMDSLTDLNGFSTVMATQTLVQMMLREVIITNGVFAELVLDKSYIPQKISVIPLESIKWIKDKDKTYKPAQRLPGETTDTSLDIPTCFHQRAVGDPTDILPRSIMEAAVKMLIYFEEVVEDIRKTLKQTGYARNVVTLDLEKIIAAAPKDVKSDAVKFAAFCEEVRSTVERTLNDVNPEDALVLFDTAQFKIESAQFGKAIDYTPLLNQISGMYATSMKTPPTVLGMRMDSGSQALGNVETLIFLKCARAIQIPVEIVMSRMLTMGARLLGSNILVKFCFKDIDLRPKTELESFFTQRQTRILEQLSLGFITDEQAAAILGTGQRPPGAPKLSGTFFQVAMGEPGPPAAGGEAPGGGSDKSPKPGDTPIGKTLQPPKSVPRKAGGKSQ
jgi:hypothetical protein